MKKIFALSFLFTVAALNLSLEKTPCEIAYEIIQSQKDLPKLEQIISGQEDFNLYVSDYYHVDEEKITGGAIYYADGAEAAEISVLLLKNESDGTEIKSVLEKYISERAEVFEGYAPIQAAMARGGIVELRGKYAALMICPDVQAARRAFFACFDSSAEAASDSSYNLAEILHAWESGDASSLSDFNRKIFIAAKKVLSEIITENMTELDKELAVHDWITHNTKFDYSVFGRSSKIRAGSDTPYGVLIDHEAMCHGYSSTFQLFMDMLKIKCITVFGIPDNRGVRHSWNMVQISGRWYCVDTAWDDPIGGSPSHRFFNVTSNFLRNSGIHNWDASNVPEAE